MSRSDLGKMTTPGFGWLAMTFADEVKQRRMEWKAEIRRVINALIGKTRDT